MQNINKLCNTPKSQYRHKTSKQEKDLDKHDTWHNGLSTSKPWWQCQLLQKGNKNNHAWYKKNGRKNRNFNGQEQSIWLTNYGKPHETPNKGKQRLQKPLGLSPMLDFHKIIFHLNTIVFSLQGNQQNHLPS